MNSWIEVLNKQKTPNGPSSNAQAANGNSHPHEDLEPSSVSPTLDGKPIKFTKTFCSIKFYYD